jgi:hypothetical protein
VLRGGRSRNRDPYLSIFTSVLNRGGPRLRSLWWAPQIHCAKKKKKTILHTVQPAFEDGTDRRFRNVGKPLYDAGEIPRRTYTIKKTNFWYINGSLNEKLKCLFFIFFIHFYSNSQTYCLFNFFKKIDKTNVITFSRFLFKEICHDLLRI